LERIGHIVEKAKSRMRIGRIYPVELRFGRYDRKDKAEADK
jgi:hypothetical protein